MDGSELIQAQVYARPSVKAILKDYPNEVDDVLQSAAVKAWTHCQDFNSRSKFDTWFTRIAIRESFQMLRGIRGRAKESRQPVPIDDRVFAIRDYRPNPDEILLSREKRKIILKNVLTLEPKYRKIALDIMQSDKDRICNPEVKQARRRMSDRLKLKLAQFRTAI